MLDHPTEYLNTMTRFYFDDRLRGTLSPVYSAQSMNTDNISLLEMADFHR